MTEFVTPKFALVAVIALLTAAACGPGPNHVNGTVGGRSIKAQMGVWVLPGATSMNVYLAEASNACELAKAKTEFNPFVLFTIWGNKPGTYPVITNEDDRKGVNHQGKVWGIFHEGPTTDVHMTEGALKVESVVEGASPVVKGSFDVKFGADSITGAFEATPCAD